MDDETAARGSALFQQLSALVTELRLPESTTIDSLGTAEILHLINEQDCKVAPAVGACIPTITEVVKGVVRSLRGGGRVFYVGAGTSGRLGVLDAAECPPTFGTAPSDIVAIMAGGNESVFQAREGAEDDENSGSREMKIHRVTDKDTVIGLAASRRTPFVRGALQEARRRGAFTALVTCNPAEQDQDLADIIVAPIVGPEIIAGSTRMKAGTAQKLVLNMISTAAMIRCGKTFGNLMIDLQPSSTKLLERARRILMEVLTISYEQATTLLDAADGSVKRAIIMSNRRVDATQADMLLKASGGFVRKALED
jgi:N-acetylmuramic acid 6-phosphate etherase